MVNCDVANLQCLDINLQFISTFGFLVTSLPPAIRVPLLVGEIVNGVAQRVAKSLVSFPYKQRAFIIYDKDVNLKNMLRN